MTVSQVHYARRICLKRVSCCDRCRYRPAVLRPYGFGAHLAHRSRQLLAAAFSGLFRGAQSTRCPISGVKQTSRSQTLWFADDPKLPKSATRPEADLAARCRHGIRLQAGGGRQSRRAVGLSPKSTKATQPLSTSGNWRQNWASREARTHNSYSDGRYTR
jgi:hypothetical protein